MFGFFLCPSLGFLLYICIKPQRCLYSEVLDPSEPVLGSTRTSVPVISRLSYSGITMGDSYKSAKEAFVRYEGIHNLPHKLIGRFGL